MTKEIINPDSHYSSGRVYSKGVKIDVGDSEMLFISGQISKNEKGEVVGHGDFAKQTEYIFEKLSTILKEAGMTLNDFVKVNIFLTNMSEFEKVSAVRDKYLMESKPASTTIEIANTTTSGCDVEIDAIAIKKKQ
jgi:reactive intermediate/imine deaminase